MALCVSKDGGGNTGGGGKDFNYCAHLRNARGIAHVAGNHAHAGRESRHSQHRDQQATSEFAGHLHHLNEVDSPYWIANFAVGEMACLETISFTLMVTW